MTNLERILGLRNVSDGPKKSLFVAAFKGSLKGFCQKSSKISTKISQNRHDKRKDTSRNVKKCSKHPQKPYKQISGFWELWAFLSDFWASGSPMT